jgi:hypothetical protein
MLWCRAPVRPAALRKGGLFRARALPESSGVEPPETIVAPAHCGIIEARTADRHARKVQVRHPQAVISAGSSAPGLRGGDVVWMSAPISAGIVRDHGEPACDLRLRAGPENAAVAPEYRRNRTARAEFITSAVSDSEREATLHRFGGGNRASTRCCRSTAATTSR